MYEIICKGTTNFINERNVWISSVQIGSEMYSGLIAIVCHSPISILRTFMDEFNEWCSPIIDSGRRIAIFGDFNIDWLSDNADSRRIKRIVNENDLHHRVIEHTDGFHPEEYCITNSGID